MAAERRVVLRFAAFDGADSRVLHEMVEMIRKGWAPLPGDRRSFISSVSHDDAATAVVAALTAAGGVYNVTDDEPLARGAWIDSLADVLCLPHPKPLPRWIARLGGSTMELLGRSQRMSNAKLRAATEWVPRWPSAREGWRSIAADLRKEAGLPSFEPCESSSPAAPVSSERSSRARSARTGMTSSS